MLKRNAVLILALAGAMGMSGCKKVVENFALDVGDNSVTSTVTFAPEFDMDTTRSAEINVKGVHYGTVGVVGSDGGNGFKVFVTADLSMFASGVWEGFGPVTTLPNGEPLPSWVQPGELVRVDIPNFSEHFDLTLYVGYKKPYYVGVALSLKILDEHYPEGLSVNQAFRKNNKTWGQAVVYGPAHDDAGNVTSHGGLFFLAGFPGKTDLKVRIHKVHKGDITVTNRKGEQLY